MKNLHKIAILPAVLICFSSVFAQTDGSKGIELYQQGRYEDAVRALKQTTKVNPDDAEGWYILGSSYLRINKIKEAKKAFEKVIDLRPADSQGYVGMSYVQIAANKYNEAQTSAQKALELDAQNFEAHYILGLLSLGGDSYNAAYNRADKVIKINPNYADAYLLKSEALTSSFGQLSGTVIKSQTERVGLLREAITNIEKYLSLSTDGKERTNWLERLESLRFFADYYEKPENQPRNNFEPNPLRSGNFIDIKINSKPRAEYTDFARNRGISGIIRLLVGFSADKNIKYILVLKGLDRGLNIQAIKAAQKINFEPATKDGQPISVVKIIEYSFSIY